MTMAISSYWSSILSCFTSRSATGTNTSVGPHKSRANVQPTCINDNHKKDLDVLLAAALTEQPYSGTGSRSELLDFEYEMYDVGASTNVVGSGNSPQERERINGHGRSQSESASPSRPRPDAQREREYNTLPRSHAQKARRHARSSSYAPVVVVPGVVNSSFLLFSPDVRGRNNKSSSVPVRRKMHTLAKSETGESQVTECTNERRQGGGREFDGETSEEGSSSPRSRSSFDSFGSSDSGSQSSYTSYGTQSTASCPDDERACALSHRSPYAISDR